jgi:hypothetical protein
MRHYCTLTDTAYLVRFLALYESMRAHCRPFTLWTLALDDMAAQKLADLDLPGASIIPLPTILDDRLVKARANRSRIEFIWTLKSSFMRIVLGDSGVPGVAHVDADMLFFSDPQPAFDEIGDAPVAVAPHRYSPRCTPRSTTPGVYNGGFVYVARSGLDFLNWWADACIEWCYWRHEPGKYVDQKYLDDAPERWGAHALQHKGAHLGPWNQEQYGYARVHGRIYVDDEPLLWYHFHKGLKPGFVLRPFVEEYIYGGYREALERAERRANRC